MSLILEADIPNEIRREFLKNDYLQKLILSGPCDRHQIWKICLDFLLLVYMIAI